jgi:hypothetical protein
MILVMFKEGEIYSRDRVYLGIVALLFEFGFIDAVAAARLERVCGFLVLGDLQKCEIVSIP